ncbi:MAG: glycoside hydrolase family 2 TIM barrel-domain containing protein [Lentisphaeria bacterium]
MIRNSRSEKDEDFFQKEQFLNTKLFSNLRKKFCLDGIWDFHFAENVKENYQIDKIEFDTVMSVPGCFDAQDKYRFRRGIGFFRRKIRCHSIIKLAIGGLGLRGKIYWDRKLVGSSELPYSPINLVFDAGNNEEHELIIATDNRIDNSPSSMFQPYYDFYGYGGIYRSVYLSYLPKTWIEYFQLTTLDITDGTIQLKLELDGNIPKTTSVSIRFDDKFHSQHKITGATGTLVLKVPDFHLWSPKDPTLHQITIDIGHEQVREYFGIRQIKAEQGKILLNEQVLKLIGYNRHDCHPQFGNAIPDSLLLNDLQMIKDQGCNMIRGSHYPQSEHMLELCDRLGLLVWDESLGWGNPVAVLQDEEFQRRQYEQTRLMVRNSINHPSIIMWGFLNEAETCKPETKPFIEKICRLIREEDESRLITFATMYGIRDLCFDLIDVISFNTYPGWGSRKSETQFFESWEVHKELDALADFIANSPWKDKPVIISEIGAEALPGDHSGRRWSEEYQAKLLETACRHVIAEPRYAGILIWQFCDIQAEENGRFLIRPYGFNNKGVVDSYRRPKLAWRTIRNLLNDIQN